MNLADVIGQTLDYKYKIESELGRGGMGTVYLATHVGTERPVAVKIIAPQFMKRPEFVERFRREARAAGRLRHPNVVDVTDFGFADTEQGQVAYLVMEYLDGCTLGEILDEEKNLPVGWTLDILEQVCSAVHEAHEQGIIHRDLKPDNIWLEPNQRGGYTVKVLDFGIAKLETHVEGEHAHDIDISIAPARPTFVGNAADTTIHDSVSPTRIFESGTVALSQAAELNTVVETGAEFSNAETAILTPAESTDQDTIGTRIISDTENGESPRFSISETSRSDADLTRVGAVLGTPLYMSPEQCRGEHLDARSDIYSLGVIAYQMLSGTTPFKGDFTDVMAAHREMPPPPLNAKKVRRKLKRVIGSALAKDPDQRPQTAEGFATIMRSRTEGIFGLLRRAGMIYTEHLTKFLVLSGFFYIPMIVFTAILLTISILRATEQIGETTASVLTAVSGVSLGIATAFGAYLIIGTTTWIVTQSLAIPLRPIKLRKSLREARKRWKAIAFTGILTTVLQIGFAIVTCGIGFLVVSVLWTLVGPVVMMENVKGWTAIKRSTALVRRSLVTSIAAVLIMFLIPAAVAGITSAAVKLSTKAIWNEVKAAEISHNETAPVASTDAPGERNLSISIGGGRKIRLFDMATDTQTKLREAIMETLLQIFLLPLQIVMTSFTAIIVALLYLKTRQAGGENLQDLLANFEESDQPRKKWQERVRQRLINSGRITPSRS